MGFTGLQAVTPLLAPYGRRPLAPNPSLERTFRANVFEGHSPLTAERRSTRLR